MDRLNTFKEMRYFMKLTQDEMARKLRIAQSTICLIESNSKVSKKTKLKVNRFCTRHNINFLME